EPRHEELPDAGPAAHGERVAAAVPAVELADHADPLGVRRPDGEPHAANAVAFVEMCAERAVRALVEAASEPLELGPVDQRRKAGGVVGLPDLAAVATPGEALTGGQRRARPPPLKERASADALERRRGLDELRLCRVRQEHADERLAAAERMRAEHAPRVVQAA